MRRLAKGISSSSGQVVTGSASTASSSVSSSVSPPDLHSDWVMTTRTDRTSFTSTM
jgi:hypothetical protein